MKSYYDLNLQISNESPSYKKTSKFFLEILNQAFLSIIKKKKNEILIRTNLKSVPMENINKIAGPFIESWALEKLEEENISEFLEISSGTRLNIADILVSFNSYNDIIDEICNIDVKATSADIKNSGRSPNITSFQRIRNAYTLNPDFIFFVLSIKHKMTNSIDLETGNAVGIMKIIDFNIYDLKLISDKDISYNPALGSGQLQIRNIHKVSSEQRDTVEFIKMLDRKFISSKKGYEGWIEYAKQDSNKWI